MTNLKKLILPTSLLLLTVILLAESNNASSNATSTSSSVVASANGADQTSNSGGSIITESFVTTPSTNDQDESNGDDGKAIKSDIEKLEKSKNNNETLNYQFYKPDYIKDPIKAMSYWVDFSKLSQQNQSTKHEMLSKSHRRAAPIKLSFDFPFYGQPLRTIIIATGGFLYVGEHLHHWLAATQNISPLMANFDLSTKNYSDIHYYDNGQSLVVQWQNVQMKGDNPPGNFSFQCTLMKNGDIIFVYASLPVPIQAIPEDDHPVKVGISDAFLIDKQAFFIRRKTIYDYHRLNMKDVQDIGNRTAIYLKALPTCNQYDSCEKCSSAATNMECIWCDAVKRCSNGYDRKRQEWLTNSCDKHEKFVCGSKQTDSSSSSTSSSTTPLQPRVAPSNSVPQPGNDSGFISKPSDNLAIISDKTLPDPRSAGESGATFLTVLMLLSLVSGIALWGFYAYKNPHTPSGQMLIKYRPSNWRWQDAETRYTAASIHM